MRTGTLPLTTVSRAIQTLFERLQACMNTSPQVSPWSQRLTFLAETILRKNEIIWLKDEHLYFVVLGKLALGKRIIVEHEFI